MALPRRKSKKLDLNDRLADAERWIKELSGLSFELGNFHGNLESGIALCIAMNKLQAGMVPAKYAKLVTKKLNAFQKRERISAFINALKKFGVRDSDIFQTDDLYNQSDLRQVAFALENLSSTAAQKGVEQPFVLGANYAKKNKRQFTEQQMQKARNAIPTMNQGSVKVTHKQGLDSHGIILQPKNNK